MALSAAEFVDDPSELVYKFFRRLLVEWLQAVTKGEATARLPRSTPAEAEAAARQRRLLEQAAEFVRPLLHKAKYQLLDKDILEHVRKMVDKALQRRFREAGVHYMELAIGNSPWPIGVGSFGIHERPSRTQIRSENISHLMNSEEHRRSITALKALLTQCQVLYPPEVASELFK